MSDAQQDNTQNGRVSLAQRKADVELAIHRLSQEITRIEGLRHHLSANEGALTVLNELAAEAEQEEPDAG